MSSSNDRTPVNIPKMLTQQLQHLVSDEYRLSTRWIANLKIVYNYLLLNLVYLLYIISYIGRISMFT